MHRMVVFTFLVVLLVGASPIWAQTIEELQDRIKALETALDELACLTTIEGSGAVADIVFKGCNVHIHNGMGETTKKNGQGNLIIGYNETTLKNFDRSGSHNLVIGIDHQYSSYGGFVTGRANTISGDFASVSGGENNIASGHFASISGGVGNRAGSQNASVSGGVGNTASGTNASVSGGENNIASGQNASVSGGGNNIASGKNTSVSGGYNSTASGFFAHVGGGYKNVASGEYANVAGGKEVKSTKDYQSRY